MVKVKPLVLEIEEEVWREYKDLIPRTIKLNDSIVELIIKEIERRKII